LLSVKRVPRGMTRGIPVKVNCQAPEESKSGSSTASTKMGGWFLAFRNSIKLVKI
jgi:hypothetical protein